MNQSVRPFRINVGFLINQPPGFQREIPFEFESYELDDEFMVTELNGTITLARTQNGMRALADMSAKTPLECGRCLDEFDQDLHMEFDEIFTFNNRPLSEDESMIPEDGYIDFEPVLREYLLLEVPFTPVCKPGCMGLCNICGQNLNEDICEHFGPIMTKETDSTKTSGTPGKR